MADIASLSFENEVFQKFAFYAAVVLLKTVFMSIWTARYRFPRKVFITPEDYGSKTPHSITPDPEVERVRRAHLNDLENVLPFVLIGLLYVLTNPDAYFAIFHFRLFTMFRLLHSIAYLCAIPQPTRVISFFIGYGVNVSMALTVLRYGSL